MYRDSNIIVFTLHPDPECRALRRLGSSAVTIALPLRAALRSSWSGVLDPLVLVAVSLSGALLVVVRTPVGCLDDGLFGVGSLGDELLPLSSREDPRALNV